MKLGQVISTRPDLISVEFSKSLEFLQDQVPPFSWRKAKKIIEKSIYQEITDIFIDFEKIPVASASVAQVYKARLKKNGAIVAVKILRPNITTKVKRDISSLKILAFLIAIFSKFFGIKLHDIVFLLQKTYEKELDLTQEAAAGSLLRDNLRDVDGFYVPKIYWDFAHKNILIMEWIEGIPFSNKEKIQSSKFDKKLLAKNLVISYFNQVYRDGFFHADMHPGNLILMENGDIAAIDFGITAFIDKKTRLSIAEILISFIRRDYKRVAELHVIAGIVDLDTNIDDMALHCRVIGESVMGKSVSEISAAKLLQSVIEMDKKFAMKNKPELLLLQKTMMLVEAIGLFLDKNINIWSLAEPWIKDWAPKNIGFDAKIIDKAINIFGDIKSSSSFFNESRIITKNVEFKNKIYDLKCKIIVCRVTIVSLLIYIII